MTEATTTLTRAAYQQAIEHIRYNIDHRYRLPNIELIDTESNLSSNVLKNILGCIGLNAAWARFSTKQRVIDVALLKVRNDIAHTGQTIDRSDVELAPVIGAVIELLDEFKNVVENAAAMRLYIETNNGNGSI